MRCYVYCQTRRSRLGEVARMTKNFCYVQWVECSPQMVLATTEDELLVVFSIELICR